MNSRLALLSADISVSVRYWNEIGPKPDYEDCPKATGPREHRRTREQEHHSADEAEDETSLDYPSLEPLWEPRNNWDVVHLSNEQGTTQYERKEDKEQHTLHGFSCD